VEKTIPATINKPGIIKRITYYIKTELGVMHLRLWLAQILVAFLPLHVGGRLRALALSMAGFKVGARSRMWGMPRIVGPRNLYENLQIGEDCWFNIGCYMDLGGKITIDDRAAIGHEVMLLTTSHHIGDAYRRVGADIIAPVHIGAGAWLGARCIILPGVTVHPGAVVGAGAVVTKDVPSNTVVAGVPAVVIRHLDE
jgi:maltose O-acetyltransferase